MSQTLPAVISPVVSIVLGTYNRLAFLKTTVEAIRADVAHLPHEIIVVDGGSTDGTARWLLAQRDIITIVQHNRGIWEDKPIIRRSWGYAMNLAFRAGTGRYICMLSDDTVVIPGAIPNGCAEFDALLAAGEPVGGLAFWWRHWPEQREYWIGRTLGGNLFVNHGLYRRDTLETVGFIDADTYAFHCADGDLCLKLAQAGYECRASERSFVEHFPYANLCLRQDTNETLSRDVAAYEAKWQGLGKPQEDWIYKSYTDVTDTGGRYYESFHRKFRWHKALPKFIRTRIG